MPRTLVVIPCFNEARRLPGDDIVSHTAAHSGVGFLLVNDGGTDDTASVLEKVRGLDFLRAFAEWLRIRARYLRGAAACENT